MDDAYDSAGEWFAEHMEEFKKIHDAVRTTLVPQLRGMIKNAAALVPKTFPEVVGNWIMTVALAHALDEARRKERNNEGVDKKDASE